MKQDPENARDSDAAASPVPSNPSASSSTPAISFSGCRALLDRLFTESGASAWGLSRDRFESALERSAAKQFASAAPPTQKLEEFLGALHVADLALACACAEGRDAAWEHFVATFRGYLRTAASAILHCSAGSPAAVELADSLFADLYGLSEGKRERSLFHYFHGRSSLKTWLRAVLAQRHVDAIRAGRRFTELDEEIDSGTAASSQSKAPFSRIECPPDPHRERYVSLLTSALEAAIGLLDQRDRDRLRMYYAQRQTLAEIGRALGEHESSVSRNLDRIRRDLRHNVELALRQGCGPVNGAPPQRGLSEEQISLCFQYASEDAPIDLQTLLPPSPQAPPKPARPQP